LGLKSTLSFQVMLSLGNEGLSCNSKELCGIHMYEIPWVLLRKRATTGLLSKRLVCKFSSKKRVTHYLRVTKKEKTYMANDHKHQSIKQGVLTI